LGGVVFVRVRRAAAAQRSDDALRSAAAAGQQSMEKGGAAFDRGLLAALQAQQRAKKTQTHALFIERSMGFVE
jgi:hypothetical protein